MVSSSISDLTAAAKAGIEAARAAKALGAKITVGRSKMIVRLKLKMIGGLEIEKMTTVEMIDEVTIGTTTIVVAPYRVHALAPDLDPSNVLLL